MCYNNVIKLTSSVLQQSSKARKTLKMLTSPVASLHAKEYALYNKKCVRKIGHVYTLLLWQRLSGMSLMVVRNGLYLTNL